MKNRGRPQDIALPSPRLHGPRSLEETISIRRSVRDFADQRLTDAELSQLLWAAQGVTDADGLRTAPSAGALYPLELYAATPTGLYKYLPAKHQLTLWIGADVRAQLCDAALGQDAVSRAVAVFIFSAVLQRTRRRYGRWAERYVYMEVGHAAQNLHLEAVALDLCSVPIAAIDDDRVSEVLQLPAAEVPLYLVPVGHPAT